MAELHGVGASSGSVVAPVFVIQREVLVIPDVADPVAAFDEAVSVVIGDLKNLSGEARTNGHEEAADVLAAQAMMAEDPMLVDGVKEALAAGTGLQAAIEGVGGELAAMLAAMTDEYLAARSADVREVTERIVGHLAGVEGSGLAGLAQPSVVVARNLTAAETSRLDAATVLGFVTEEGGASGHVAVIARSLGIPAVVGAIGAVGMALSGSVVALDGDSGRVVVDPGGDVIAEFEERLRTLQRRREAAAAYRGRKASFGDIAFAVAANVAGPDDVNRAVESAADGIGLYRTEFLFLDRRTPPSEDEQVEVYRGALAAFSEPVVIRTFDIGGDKPASYLDMPAEENPFLGERGVRVYSRFGELFATQVRALLRAAVAGGLWVMVPMIATVGDLLEVREVFDRTAGELTAAGIEIGRPRLGVMIEVPAAAVIADRLAVHADFFSIGTNDLTQYAMAADRTNGHLARYADAASPGVLDLCQMTAEAGTRAGIPVSVCGEAAADPVLATLYAAMGITKLSVSPPSVDLVKAVVDRLDPSTAADVLAVARRCESAREVRDAVARLLEGTG